MKCPHCITEFHGNPVTIALNRDDEGYWGVLQQVCPACSKVILHAVCSENPIGQGEGFQFTNAKHFYLCRPRVATRPPPPEEVPEEFREDYIEACLVIADSPKASAALSRRCLQHVLRERVKVKPGSLASEIDQVINDGTLPSYLAEAIDAVRNIGNFAAHPIKSTTSGEVTPVEPGESEWNLDVLDGLFDFYFVQPETLKKKRDALNQKLADAGKPPVKPVT